MISLVYDHLSAVAAGNSPHGVDIQNPIAQTEDKHTPLVI